MKNVCFLKIRGRTSELIVFTALQVIHCKTNLSVLELTMKEQEHHASGRGGIMSFLNKPRGCEVSVVSDKTFASTFEVNGASTESDTSSCTDESALFDGRTDFIIECNNQEMVFVTSAQGRAVLSRCHYFRDCFLSRWDETEDRILKKPDWTLGIARRLVELLTTGSTWIENDASCFAELVQAAEHVSVELRLGSLINYYDILSKEDTTKFFNMLDLEKYQFKFQATVKSWQWLELMRRGILLLLKSKVIVVKAAPKIAHKAETRPAPSKERLNKCDSIRSEFCVYADGKMNVLLTMLDILNPATTPEEKKRRHTEQEEIRIVYLSKIHTVRQEDLEMLWRVTSASYTIATSEDRKYMESHWRVEDLLKQSMTTPNAHENDNRSIVPERLLKSGSIGDETSACSKSTPMTGTVGSKILTMGYGGGKPPIPKTIVTDKSDETSKASSDSLHCRTISCNSFLVLKHLFDSINEEDEDFPASLIVKSPTPDTLGRLINACRACPDERNELGVDIQKNTYFATKSSKEVKAMLSYLADYSSSAVVAGDFKLVEFKDNSKKA